MSSRSKAARLAAAVAAAADGGNMDTWDESSEALPLPAPAAAMETAENGGEEENEEEESGLLLARKAAAAQHDAERSASERAKAAVPKALAEAQFFAPLHLDPIGKPMPELAESDEQRAKRDASGKTKKEHELQFFRNLHFVRNGGTPVVVPTIFAPSRWASAEQRKDALDTTPFDIEMGPFNKSLLVAPSAFSFGALGKVFSGGVQTALDGASTGNEKWTVKQTGVWRDPLHPERGLKQAMVSFTLPPDAPVLLNEALDTLVQSARAVAKEAAEEQNAVAVEVLRGTKGLSVETTPCGDQYNWISPVRPFIGLVHVTGILINVPHKTVQLCCKLIAVAPRVDATLSTRDWFASGLAAWANPRTPLVVEEHRVQTARFRKALMLLETAFEGADPEQRWMFTYETFKGETAADPITYVIKLGNASRLQAVERTFAGARNFKISF